MTSLMLWPQRSAFDLSDSLFHEFLTPGTPRRGERAESFRPATEVLRQGGDAVIRLELPGVNVEQDVTVELKDSQLVVHGERRDEIRQEDPGTQRSFREVRYGSFRRSFTVPSHVAPEDVTAEYDAGILTVRIAHAHDSRKEQRIPITRRSGSPESLTEVTSSEQSPATESAPELTE